MPVRKAIAEKDGVYFITFIRLRRTGSAPTGCHYLNYAMLIMPFTIGLIPSKNVIITSLVM
jgi:hypothetical protein